MLVGCDCHCKGTPQSSVPFDSLPASGSDTNSSGTPVPTRGCTGCMDEIAPVRFNLEITYNAGEAYDAADWPACQYYNGFRKYALYRQEYLPGLEHCCVWESVERAKLLDQTVPRNSPQRLVNGTIAKAWAVVWSQPPGTTGTTCPHSSKLSYGAYKMAAGLQYQVKTSATNTQTRELWFVKDPNAIGPGGTVDCLAANSLVYWESVVPFPFAFRRWVKTFGGGNSADWGPCPNGYYANNGIPASVILRAAAT
jgi:hypothetical protein